MVGRNPEEIMEGFELAQKVCESSGPVVNYFRNLIIILFLGRQSEKQENY